MIDEDGDGIETEYEILLGTSSTDADSDEDGLLDGLEAHIGTSAVDCDSDDDSLSDGLEYGVYSVHSDTDTQSDCYTLDRDLSTSTDPLDDDTDGGGISDGEEDINGNGRVDEWELDPANSSDDLDLDNDAISDALEEHCRTIHSGTLDDADGDSLLDIYEPIEDIDQDSLPSFCDTDDDGDGILTAIEGTDDSDGDGTIDSLDLDSIDGIQMMWMELGTRLRFYANFQDSAPEDGPCGDQDLTVLVMKRKSLWHVSY